MNNKNIPIIFLIQLFILSYFKNQSATPGYSLHKNTGKTTIITTKIQ